MGHELKRNKTTDPSCLKSAEFILKTDPAAGKSRPKPGNFGNLVRIAYRFPGSR